MKIDNSRAKSWFECPLGYKERYVNNLEPVGKWETVGFGTRLHQLLEVRHNAHRGAAPAAYPPCIDPGLEAEAQLTFAAYEACYPEEPFDIEGVEEYFEVPLGNHLYVGEFDAIVRMKDSGRLRLFETKTEKRGSKTNNPDSWQQKSQVGLYLWAAEEKYGEQFEGIILNVITRQSPAGQERPRFRRDDLVRTSVQRREAVENITWIAGQIESCAESGFWPSNRNKCVSEWGWKCDYFPLHSTEDSSEALVKIKFKPAEEYLSGL